MVTATKGTKKRKAKRSIPIGVCHVQSTFNNTIITISDINGNVLLWESAGTKGFKGSRKSTPFAAQVAAESIAKRALDMGMHTISVLVKGPGGGREGVIRSLAAAGLKIAYIEYVTPIPHNGYKKKKRRRV